MGATNAFLARNVEDKGKSLCKRTIEKLGVMIQNL